MQTYVYKDELVKSKTRTAILTTAINIVLEVLASKRI